MAERQQERFTVSPDVSDISLTCPIQPHELDKRLDFGLRDIARRVTTKAVLEGRGADILLRIYMAGMYHGFELGKGLVNG